MVGITKFKDNTETGYGAESIESASTTAYNRCRAVYIGTSQDLDFTFNGTTWVKFQGCVAGTVLPIQALGARKNAGSAACDAGDVLFIS